MLFRSGTSAVTASVTAGSGAGEFCGASAQPVSAAVQSSNVQKYSFRFIIVLLTVSAVYANYGDSCSQYSILSGNCQRISAISYIFRTLGRGSPKEAANSGVKCCSLGVFSKISPRRDIGAGAARHSIFCCKSKILPL